MFPAIWIIMGAAILFEYSNAHAKTMAPVNWITGRLLDGKWNKANIKELIMTAGKTLNFLNQEYKKPRKNSSSATGLKIEAVKK